VEDKLEKLTNAFDKSCGQRNSSLLLPAELHGNRSSIDNSNYRDLQSYPLRMRKGKLTRLPEDFEFPSSTPWDCWVQWNEGNAERGIPPLRFIPAEEYTFLDAKEKTDIQIRTSGGTGHGSKKKRRPSRKIANDLKCFCTYIEKRATAARLNISDRCRDNLKNMFYTADIDKLVKRDSSSWTTALRMIRKIKNKN
jgi:hypothetical protein